MIVYQKTKREFIDDVRHDRLAEGIRESVQTYLNRKTLKSESDSWRNSGVYMCHVFADWGVTDDCDNCLITANHDQSDNDDKGVGDQTKYIGC